MTFLGRFNNFECNDCGETVSVSTFPKGWVTTRTRTEAPHHCGECVKKLPKGTRIWTAGAKEQDHQTVK